MITRVKNKEDLFEMFLYQAVVDCVYREAEEFALMELPDEIEVASSSRAKDMRLLCLREDRKERFKRKGAPRLRRTTVAAALVLAVLTGSMMTYPAVRASVADVFVEWFDQFTKYTGSGATNEDSAWELAYVPEGYAETYRFQDDSEAILRYEDNEGNFLIFRYQASAVSISVDNEGMQYNRLYANDTTYELYESLNEGELSTIIWTEKGTIFSVTGYLDMSMLMEVVFSVIKK